MMLLSGGKLPEAERFQPASLPAISHHVECKSDSEAVSGSNCSMQTFPIPSLEMSSVEQELEYCNNLRSSRRCDSQLFTVKRASWILLCTILLCCMWSENILYCTGLKCKRFGICGLWSNTSYTKYFNFSFRKVKMMYHWVLRRNGKWAGCLHDRLRIACIATDTARKFRLKCFLIGWFQDTAMNFENFQVLIRRSG